MSDTIFGTFTADTNSEVFTVSGDGESAGVGIFVHVRFASGTGTVTLKRFEAATSTYQPVINAAWTSSIDKEITLPHGEQVILSMSSSSTPVVPFEILNLSRKY